MSLKYGLNLKKNGAAPPRRTLLDDGDDGDDGDDDVQPAGPATEEIRTFGSTGHAPSPPAPARSRPQPTLVPTTDDKDGPRQDLSVVRAAKAQVEAAEGADSSIFDYDSFHAAKTAVTQAKRAADKRDAVERRPKYIGSLLDAAARRKQDQQVAREKLLQREREAEGDEFADKEKFVTGAYKAQLEETRRLEREEQERQAAEEEQRKRQLGGGMQRFYRAMMDQHEQQHQATREAAAAHADTRGVRAAAGADAHTGKSDAELAADARAKGITVHVNDDGHITDKRELLAAGLNVAPAGTAPGAHGSDHLKTANRHAPSFFPPRHAASHQAARERHTRLVEEQLAERAKRAREEAEDERARQQKAAKSTKTDQDVRDAKARYLARKAARERGEA